MDACDLVERGERRRRGFGRRARWGTSVGPESRGRALESPSACVPRENPRRFCPLWMGVSVSGEAETPAQADADSRGRAAARRHAPADAAAERSRADAPADDAAAERSRAYALAAGRARPPVVAGAHSAARAAGGLRPNWPRAACVTRANCARAGQAPNTFREGGEMPRPGSRREAGRKVQARASLRRTAVRAGIRGASGRVPLRSRPGPTGPRESAAVFADGKFCPGDRVRILRGRPARK